MKQATPVSNKHTIATLASLRRRRRKLARGQVNLCWSARWSASVNGSVNGRATSKLRKRCLATQPRELVKANRGTLTSMDISVVIT
jgi:hypothetical protein